MRASLTSVACLVCFAASTLGQIPGSISTVVLNLTLSTTLEGTVQKDETTGKPLSGKDEEGNPLAIPTFFNSWWFSKEDRQGNVLSEEGHEEYSLKIGVRRYGNKEFLTDLLGHGYLPEDEGGTGIAGWSLAEVSGTFAGLDDFDLGPEYLYAVHAKRGLSILLTGIVIQRDYAVRSGEAENWYHKSSHKIDYVRGKEIKTLSHTRNWEFVQRYLLDFDGYLQEGDFSISAYQFQGVCKRAEVLTQVATGNAEDPVTRVYRCGPSKMDQISGSGPRIQQNFFGFQVVRGSMTTSTGKVVPDIADMFPEAASGQ